MSMVTRTLSFFTTWLLELARQPILVATLILGPFVILLAFGQGVDVSGIKPKVIVIQGTDPDQEIQPLPEELNEYVEVVDQSDDLAGSIKRLRDGEVDAVAVIPPDPAGQIQRGEHIPVQMFTSEIDPLTESFTEAYLSDQVAQLNQRTIEEAISEAQESVASIDGLIAEAREYVALAKGAGDDIDTIRAQVSAARETVDPIAAAADDVVEATRGISFVLPGIGRTDDELEALRNEVNELAEALESLDRRLGTGSEAVPAEQELDEIDAQLAEISARANDLQAIPPDVLSAPFELDLENVSPFEPEFTKYYSPAVLVLLLQHLGISLAALSLTRIRLLGLMSMLRVAPIRAFEIMNGQYVSYALILVGVGGAVLAAMHWLLDVPIFGPWSELIAVLLLLIAVSLGIGFLVSLLTSSEQQASQFAMLVLLAAVFFSGLVVALDRLSYPVRALSFALPSTYATRSAQDVMLRGVLRHPEDLAVMAAAAIVLYAATVFLLRRQLSPE
jgi:ABC-2 type transport system permease protein